MKIVAEKRVRSYELTFLVPASLTSDKISGTVAEVLELVKKHKLTVTTQEDWGKKDLAYPIRFQGGNEREAMYTHVVLEADASKVQAFERDLYLNSNVIRHLLVLAESRGTELGELQEQKEE